MNSRAENPTPELHRVAEHFAALSAHAFDGVLLYDAGFVLNATTGVARLFQRAPIELARCRVSRLIARESRPVLLQHLRSLSQRSCPAVGVRADGSRFPIVISVQARVTLNGRHVKVVALRDASRDEASHDHLTDREIARSRASRSGDDALQD